MRGRVGRRGLVRILIRSRGERHEADSRANDRKKCKSGKGEVYVEGWAIARRVWVVAVICGGALGQAPAAVQTDTAVQPVTAVQSGGAVQAPAAQGGTIEGRVVAGAGGKGGAFRCRGLRLRR